MSVVPILLLLWRVQDQFPPPVFRLIIKWTVLVRCQHGLVRVQDQYMDDGNGTSAIEGLIGDCISLGGLINYFSFPLVFLFLAWPALMGMRMTDCFAGTFIISFLHVVVPLVLFDTDPGDRDIQRLMTYFI